MKSNLFPFGLIIIFVAVLWILSGVFLGRDIASLSDEDYRVKHINAYRDFSEVFIEAARGVLDVTNLHDPHIPSKRYTDGLTPLQKYAYELNKMRLDLKEFLTEDERWHNDPEFCIGMAKMLLYNAIYEVKGRTYDMLKKDVEFWLKRHAVLVIEADSADTQYARNHYFFWGFLRTYQADQKAKDLKYDEFNELLSEALEHYSMALSVSNMYNDHRPWISPILNIQSIMSKQYASGSSVFILDTLSEFSSDQIKQIKPVDSLVQLSYSTVQSLAAYINHAEILLAKGDTSSARNLIRQMINWRERNIAEIRMHSKSSAIYFTSQIIESLELIADVLGFSSRMSSPNHAVRCGKDSVFNFVERTRLRLQSSGLNDLEYARSIMNCYLDFILLQWYEAITDENERLRLERTLTGYIANSRNTWFYDIRTTVPALLLKKFSVEFEEHKQGG